MHIYALCILLGFFVAFLLSNYRANKLKRMLIEQNLGEDTNILTFEHLVNIVLTLMVAGVIGARLYYVITVPSRYIADPLSIFAVNQGGLGIMGGVIFGAFGTFAYCKFAKLNISSVIWCIIPCVPIAQAIGRLGNWFNGELYGTETNLPWGLDLSRGHYEETVFYHPTFLYEIIWNLIVATVLWKACSKFSTNIEFKRFNQILPLYLSLYTFGRMFIEMLRTDTSEYFLDLRINLWCALALFIMSTIWLVVLHLKLRNKQ